MPAKNRKRSWFCCSLLEKILEFNRRPRPSHFRLNIEVLEERAVPATITWINSGSGNWDTAANWSTGSIPGSSDDAVINTAAAATITIQGGDSLAVHSLTTSATDALALTGGSLSLAANSSLGGNLTISNGLLFAGANLTIAGTLTQTGGTLAGPGNVTIAGTFQWFGGSMSGAGTTQANGGLQLGANPGDAETLSARTLINKGAGTFSASDTLIQNAGASFQNLAGATLDIKAGAFWSGDDSSDTLVNAGALTVDALGGTVAFDVYFANSGSVAIAAGTLSLHGGGAETGSTTVASGATLLFRAFGDPVAFTSTAALTGAGTVELDGDSWATFGPGTTYNLSGTTFLTGGELVLDDASATIGTLDLTGGELSGSANVTVTGATAWSGGTITGSGSIDAKAGLQLGIAGATDSTTESLLGRTLINEGSATMFRLNTFSQTGGSTFDNLHNATVTAQDGSDWGVVDDDSNPSFINEGTLIVDAGSGGLTLIQTYVESSGSIQVESGTLGLGASGSIEGPVSVAAGATFQLGKNFNAEVFTFSSTSTISGAGAVDFGSGLVANFTSGSTYNITGSTTIDTSGGSGDNVMFPAGSNVSSLGNLSIDTGEVDFNTGNTITVPSLTQSSGTLNGSDAVVVTGATVWTGGSMTGTGSTTAMAGLTLGADGDPHDEENLDARTLVNVGAATWVGGGEIDIDWGGNFINQAGATFAEESPNPIFTNIGVGQFPSGTVTNQGTFTVASGGTAALEPFLINTGTVEIESGTWTLSGNGTGAGGTIQVDAGATFNLNMFYALPNVTGPGTVNSIQASQANPGNFIGGTITGNNFLVVNGNVSVSTLNMTGGFLIVNGTLTVTGSMLFDAGYIVGPGKIIAEGGLTLGTIVGGQSEIYGVELVNDGAATIFGQTQEGWNSGAVFVNPVGSTVTIQGGGQGIQADGSVSILNQGSITAAVGVGASFLIQFTNITNSGSISVTSGTLSLQSGGQATGSYGVGAGSTIDFGHSSWIFNSGSLVKGAGAVIFSSNPQPSYFDDGSTYDITGTTFQKSTSVLAFLPGSSVQSVGALTLSVGGINFDTGAAVSLTSLNESGGNLTGPDTVTITGATAWTAGEMSGAGSTVAQGGLVLGAAGLSNQSQQLDERTLINAGAGTINGNQLILQETSGAAFVNASGAILTINNGVTLQDAGDNTSTFQNNGSITVIAGNSANAVTISSSPGRPAFLTNAGSIELSTGTLVLRVDGSSTGALTADASTLLEFTDNSNFGLNFGSTTSGAGTFEFNGELTREAAGATFNVTGLTSIAGGVEFDGPITLASLNLLNGGTLTGPGTVTISGLATWTGGIMSGPGTTITAGGLLIGLPADTSDSETLSARTVNSSSSTTWAGKGSFTQNDGSIFVNLAGATFTIQNDIGWSSDGTTVFNNAGTFAKAAISATTVFKPALNNSGTVQVQQGTLNLTAVGIVGGTYSIGSSGVLMVDSDAITPTTPAFPDVFTSGNWAATFAGTSTDTSGTGIASVGVSLFDGTHYFNGTAFVSTTPVFNPATLNGSAWTYAIPVAEFASDLSYTVQSQAIDHNGGAESSTTTLLTLSQAAPQVSAVTPSFGPVTGGATVTISGSYLTGATLVDFGSNNPATIVSSTPVSIVVTVPAGTLGVTDVTVTTDLGTSTISAADKFTYLPLPISSVTALPSLSKPSFAVSWSGTDVGGPGVASFDIFVSDNGGLFTAFLTGTTQVSATFNGADGHTYGFYSVATDSDGVRGAALAAAQATTQTVLDSPNKVYVDAVYEALLSRHADLAGLNFWSGQLDQGGPRSTLINLIDHSAEYFGTIIKPAYLQYLGRAADPAGLSFWTGQMQNGLTDQQLEAGFIASDEFFAKSGGTNATWVNALYMSLLGRPADPDGESFWTQQLADGVTRESVAFGFADSTEREGQLVEADYEAFLGRPAGPSEIAFWVGQFSMGGTNENIVTGFVSSDEFFNKTTS